MSIQSTLLQQIPHLIHGFGTLDEPIPDEFTARWSQIPQWKQVHGISVAEVTEAHQSCGEVDALLTRTPHLPIGVVTADCVPILLAHREGQLVAAIHAGWRGTYARIVENVWNTLKNKGEDPSNWLAAIGPCIGPCCYEVSEELTDQFHHEFSEISPKKMTPSHRKLDLAAIHEATLKTIGFSGIDVIRRCTQCSIDPQFHSYRREKGNKRQYSMIEITHSTSR